MWKLWPVGSGSQKVPDKNISTSLFLWWDFEWWHSLKSLQKSSSCQKNIPSEYPTASFCSWLRRVASAIVYSIALHLSLPYHCSPPYHCCKFALPQYRVSIMILAFVLYFLRHEVLVRNNNSSIMEQGKLPKRTYIYAHPSTHTNVWTRFSKWKSLLLLWCFLLNMFINFLFIKHLFGPVMGQAPFNVLRINK